jgi:hypothetical protein
MAVATGRGPGGGSGVGEPGVGRSDDGRFRVQEGQLLRRAFRLLALGFGRLLGPCFGGFAPNAILLPAQGPRLGQTGTAPDLCPCGAVCLSLPLGQRPAIGFRGGTKSGPQAELLRRPRVPGFGIPAPALFAVPPVVNVLAPLSTLRNIRWRYIIHWLASVIAAACRRFGSGLAPPAGILCSIWREDTTRLP